MTDDLAEGVPFFLGEDNDGAPSVLATIAVGVMRGSIRTTVFNFTGYPPADDEVEDERRQEAHARLILRDIKVIDLS